MDSLRIMNQERSEAMSKILKKLSGPSIGGNEMPWPRAAVIEGTRFVACSGCTGRDPNKKQEYPELTDNPNCTTGN